MAKPTAPLNRSKVRLFFVDADLAAGDMQELTHALTTAIRPTHVLARSGETARLMPARASDGSDGAGEAESVDEGEQVAVEEPRATPTPKSGAPRNYRKPRPVEMDMNGDGLSFEAFAKEKAPTSHRAKYLVAAAWCHDHAELPTVTVDHVYTCYKAADWVFDVVDPGFTLRQLKGEGLGTIQRGKFSINHLGLSEVKKMNTST